MQTQINEKSLGKKNISEFSISADWLQIHVSHDFYLFSGESDKYRIERTGQTKVFKNVFSIFEKKENNQVATYCTDANACIMPAGEGVLKFENNILYIHHGILKNYVSNFLNDLNLKFIGITRLDIAFDIMEFSGGMQCNDFIKDYVTCKLVKKNDSKFSVYGKQNRAGHEFETLKFGSPQSDVNIKMYNKTKEMLVNYKPHIDLMHRQNFKENYGKKDIWRIEFSLKSMKSVLENENKKFNFYSLDILEIHNYYGLFMQLFKEKFCFKINEGIKKKFCRLKDISLWIFQESILSLAIKKCEKTFTDTSRAIKSYIKKLDLRRQAYEVGTELRNCFDRVINDYVFRGNLQWWAEANWIYYL